MSDGPPAFDVEMISLIAPDGQRVIATHFRPAEPKGPKVLILSAIGVPARYYADYAKYLAGAGLETMTLDYRGIGASRPERLCGFTANLRDWAERDAEAALDHLLTKDNRPVVVLGHSFGAQTIGLMPSGRKIAALLGIAAQTGDLAHWPRWRRIWSTMRLRVVVPALIALFGYFPGRVLGGADLPAEIMRDISRYSRIPGFIKGESPHLHRYHDYRGPIRFYGFEDDTWGPIAAVEGLLDYYTDASDKVLVRVRPADYGAESIGHVGFFKLGPQNRLWSETREWIAAQSS